MSAANGTAPTLGALAVRVDAMEERLDEHRGEVLRAIAAVSNQVAKLSHAVERMPQTIADIADARAEKKWDESSKVTKIETLTMQRDALLAERTQARTRWWDIAKIVITAVVGIAAGAVGMHWFH